MKQSLRLRLMIWFVFISLLLGGIAAILSWQETREKIDEFFDTYQIALARQLATADWNAVSPQTQKITDKMVKRLHNGENEDEAIGFAVFEPGGRRVFHDGENGREFEFVDYQGGFFTQKVDGEKWRIVQLKSPDGNYIAAVGQELEYRDEVAWDMAEEFMLPWGGGLLSLLAAMMFIISRELRPLRSLAEELEQRPIEDLSPLGEEGIPSEALSLVRAMNERLRQIENLLERERQFTADAAHELRTPLTALKVQLEVLQLCSGDKDAQNEAVAKLGRGINRCARLVEQLLALAKADAAINETEEDQTVDWPNIFQRLTEDYKSAVQAKGLQINGALNGEGPIEHGNVLLISLLARNLFDNAIKYSPEGAEITVRIEKESLAVINSDSFVPEALLDKLGQRFYRPAGHNEPGSGLGLAIASRIAARYGCQLKFSNTGEGFKAECIKIS